MLWNRFEPLWKEIFESTRIVYWERYSDDCKQRRVTQCWIICCTCMASLKEYHGSNRNIHDTTDTFVFDLSDRDRLMEWQNSLAGYLAKSFALARPITKHYFAKSTHKKTKHSETGNSDVWYDANTAQKKSVVTPVPYTNSCTVLVSQHFSNR